MSVVDPQLKPVAVIDPVAPVPVKTIKPEVLNAIGQELASLFTQYASDRRLVELKWVRNLRQYLGIYDPEVEQALLANQSRAYPRVTRVKCISVLSRIMNLMFPGNERNWELKASPSAEMSPQDVMMAVQQMMATQPGAQPAQAPVPSPTEQMPPDQSGMSPAGAGPGMPPPQSMATMAPPPPQLTDDMVHDAVQALADQRADLLSRMIDDQLQEIGGDQTLDYIALNRKVAQSGIQYGLGLLRGPFVRESTQTKWCVDPTTMQATPRQKTVYKPQFDFLPIWDFYPDMSAKTLAGMDGYFIRMVMSRAQLRALADRTDFFSDQIKNYISINKGNYKPREFETDLRSIGVKQLVNEQRSDDAKYEILVWNGTLSGKKLRDVGADVPDDKLADDIEAEVWMVGGTVIKADINAWRKMGLSVRTIHTFMFDEDDTSPIGNGLPNVIRDSQMSVAAATRMLLDNAGVVCGPNMEINTDLMRADQDLTSVHAYKNWYREGSGPDAQFPAIRNIPIDGHINELMQTVELFLKFADMETFVGPATGGDMAQAPSEPMRTAAGASMLRGDAALPFKDIVRNFDSFTQSVIQSIVQFNCKFNPGPATQGDYNVIARGATSLIAKEVRGMQVDQLATTLTPTEMFHVDERKLVEQRFAVRDLTSMLVPPNIAQQRKDAADQQQGAMSDAQMDLINAQVREALSMAFKNIAQGQKNTAAADAAQINAGLAIMEKGMDDGTDKPGGASAA